MFTYLTYILGSFKCIQGVSHLNFFFHCLHFSFILYFFLSLFFKSPTVTVFNFVDFLEESSVVPTKHNVLQIFKVMFTQFSCGAI